ncbi:MAG: hypothetical protein HZC41_06405 [Chloroflexi bacterium]|nr:hypothetical protein [Chloroflexota bacterium]
MDTHFAGYANGDAHEMTRHIWWFKHALQTGQPLFFQPLLAYPDGLEGVILWSNPLQFFPAWLFAFVLPLPAAYNLQALLNLALNGWAAYFLVRHLTRHTPAALLAGVVFMASPAIQGHLAGGHGGLLVQWPLPLLAWALVRLRDQFPVASRQLPEDSYQLSVISYQSVSSLENPELGTRNFPLSTQYSVLSTILFLVLLPLGHTLQLVYAGLPLVGLFALTLLAERNGRALRWLVAAVAAALVILLAFLLPVAGATLGTSAYTDEGGSVTYSLDLLALATPSFNHPLYGQWEYTHRVLGTNIVEGSAYVGVFVALLALVAVWKRREARWWLLVALVVWLLALGPLLKVFDRPVSFTTDGYETFITLPWALVQDLPIFNLARTPGRFNFLLALAVAVLGGYGWLVFSLQSSVFSFKSKTAKPKTENRKPKTDNSELGTRNFPLSTQYSVLSTLLLIALILLDYQSFWPLPTYSADIPQAVYQLAQRNNVRAVFDIPWDNVLAAKDALWLQTAHQKPMIAGHISRKTPVDPAKLAILQATLVPELLREAGVDVVIVHKAYDEMLAVRVRERWGEPFYEDTRLALYDVPDAYAQPAFVPLPAPIDGLPERPLSVFGDQVDSYVYTAEPAWVRLEATVEVYWREVNILVDGQVINGGRIESDGESTQISLQIPLPQPGYHTITLALDPPCPQHYAETLLCNALTVTALKLDDFMPHTFEAIPFERGLTLAGSLIQYVDDNSPQPGKVEVSLWWRFDQLLTGSDTRFVHVTRGDDPGYLVNQTDSPLGEQSAAGQWVETLTLEIPDDLNFDSYDLYTGWYSYPDMQRFGVQANTPRAQDGLAYLGSVTVQ